MPPEAKVVFSRSTADVLATPSVRHFARQKGVDLSLLAPGSGKGGRIEKRDVDTFLSGPIRATGAAEPPATTVDDLVVELGRTRYGMWKATSVAKKKDKSLNQNRRK